MMYDLVPKLFNQGNSAMTFSITYVSITTLSITILSITTLDAYNGCHNVQCRIFYRCKYELILSIVMLRVLILSVVLLDDDMLSVVASYNMFHLGLIPMKTYIRSFNNNDTQL
jgi:hypothetical protein